MELQQLWYNISGRVTHICVSEQGHHWFRYWTVAWWAPSHHLCQWWAINHYLNQCWNIVYGTIRNTLQWNFNRNICILIQENPFENVVMNSRPFCLGLNVLIPNCGEYRYNMVHHNAMFAQHDNSKDTTNFRISRACHHMKTFPCFPGHRWIPLTKARDSELWCFPWFAPEQTGE